MLIYAPMIKYQLAEVFEKSIIHLPYTAKKVLAIISTIVYNISYGIYIFIPQIPSRQF